MQDVETRKCSKCKISKSFDSFAKHKGKPLGIRYTCKQCDANFSKKWKSENPNYQAEYYQKNKTQILLRMKTHRLENLDAKRRSARVYAQLNKEKMSKTNADWVRSNPEKNRAKKARRRALEIQAQAFFISSKQIEKLYLQKCIYCGSAGPIELDHVIPISRGGSHSLGNLVSACRPCNRSKGNKMIMEWRLGRR